MVVCKQSAAVQPILERVTQWLRERQLAVFVEPSTYTRLVGVWVCGGGGLVGGGGGTGVCVWGDWWWGVGGLVGGGGGGQGRLSRRELGAGGARRRPGEARMQAQERVPRHAQDVCGIAQPGGVGRCLTTAHILLLQQRHQAQGLERSGTTCPLRQVWTVT